MHDSTGSDLENTGQAEANSSPEFAAMLEQSLKPAPERELKAGDRVRGRIVLINAEAAFVDFGGRSEGMLALSEIANEEGKPRYEVGQEIEAAVASLEGQVTLTLALRKDKVDTTALRQAMESGLPVEGQVKAVNAGGFEVRVAGVRGFCPFSQMDLHPVGDGQAWLHKTLPFKIIELGEGGRRVVLSRRALLEEERRQRGDAVRGTLAVGQELDGAVTRLAPFGAFVDLGGVEGLVHISELSTARVTQVADAVHPGQKVRVKIKKIEKLGEPGERVSLSMRALEADPWAGLMDKIHEGDVLQGRIVRLADFGAFVEVMPGIDGLVHVSQISRRRVAHPRDVVQEGQEVTVKVTKIDPAAKRLSLSIREAESAAPTGEPVTAGQVLDGVVAGIKPYGLFVDLPSGQTGLLPRPEMDVPRGAALEKLYNEGDTVRVSVLEVQADGKIRLSTKAAAERDEADTAARYLPQHEAKPAAAAAPATGAFAEALRRAEEKKSR